MIHFRSPIVGRPMCGAAIANPSVPHSVTMSPDDVTCAECARLLLPPKHRPVPGMFAKRPANPTWKRVNVPKAPHIEFWQRGDVWVGSELSIMQAPDGSGDDLPQWLVSVSEFGRQRPSDQTMQRVRHDFDMAEAEEDNHADGATRSLFLVVDPARRVDCECKADEQLVTRADGYQFSRKKVVSP